MNNASSVVSPLQHLAIRRRCGYCRFGRLQTFDELEERIIFDVANPPLPLARKKGGHPIFNLA